MTVENALPTDPKDVLVDYLARQRNAVIWKLENISERSARMPMTPTGSNLLGIAKHVASIEQGYLVECFGLPAVVPAPWLADDAEDNADMWATPDQSKEWVLDFYRKVIAASDASIGQRDLADTATVPWWPPERRHPTLGLLLTHVIQETARHAGQMDIVREQLDGAIGYSPINPNLPPGDTRWWADYVAKLRAVAESFD